MTQITSTSPSRRIVPGDPEWPDALNAMADPPTGLWARGTADLAALADGACTVIGARASTAYGNLVAHDLGHDLAKAGVPLINGGSFGIEVAALRGALTARSALPVVILAGGLDIAYPNAHAALFETVLRAGGLLVGEQPLGVVPTKALFLRRNEIMAALGSTLVLVEAASRTGCSSTVAVAEEMGRPILAVPGPITSVLSAYPHELIRSGRAALALSHLDVLERMRPAMVHGPDAVAGMPRIADGEALDTWLIVSGAGTRHWYATDRSHAIEQHELAFGNDEDEEIIEVRPLAQGILTPEELQRRARA